MAAAKAKKPTPVIEEVPNIVDGALEGLAEYRATWWEAIQESG
jgi:hypothetical protein